MCVCVLAYNGMKESVCLLVADIFFPPEYFQSLVKYVDEEPVATDGPIVFHLCWENVGEF